LLSSFLLFVTLVLLFDPALICKSYCSSNNCGNEKQSIDLFQKVVCDCKYYTLFDKREICC
jgi:hypothetical protein